MSILFNARFGSEYIKQNFLKPAIAGDLVTCIGITEPSGGSDVSSIILLISVLVLLLGTY